MVHKDQAYLGSLDYWSKLYIWPIGLSFDALSIDRVNDKNETSMVHYLYMTDNKCRLMFLVFII